MSGPSGGSAAAAQREQKAMDAATETMLNKVNETRQTLLGLITKLETDPLLNWHSFLDSQALISGQLNSLMKSVKSERVPSLKKYTALPLLLSADRDEDLVRMTENRVASFNHDLVPHYLRTKPEPQVENKYTGYEARANAAKDTLSKQCAVMEKVTKSMLQVITRESDDILMKAQTRGDVEKTHSVDDTMHLIQAVTHGKSLKQHQPGQGPAGVQGGGPQHPGGNRGGPGGPNQGNAPSTSGPKAPSTIKTNIKAATQVHPYHRQ